MGFPQFSKKLSNEELLTLANGNTKPLVKLLQNLQLEISAKDTVLKRKDEELLELQNSVQKCERDLSETRKKLNEKHLIGNNEIVSVYSIPNDLRKDKILFQTAGQHANNPSKSIGNDRQFKPEKQFTGNEARRTSTNG